MAAHLFPKSQHLKSRKKLQQLFAQGKSVRADQVRIVYLNEPAPVADTKCGVGMTTKYFKKAVDRNRIKRLLREAYRLQQDQIRAKEALSLFILYTGKELPVYAALFENVGVALRKLDHILHANNPKNT